MAATWTNGNGTNIWSDGPNWDTAAKPQVAEDVIFDGTSTDNCVIDEATAALGALTFAAGYTGDFDAATFDVTATDVDTRAGAGGTIDLGDGNDWTVSGNWESRNTAATFVPGTAVVKMTGAAKTMSVSGGNVPNNITIVSGATISLLRAVANASLVITIEGGGAELDQNGFDIGLIGGVVIASGGTLTGNAGDFCAVRDGDFVNDGLVEVVECRTNQRANVEFGGSGTYHDVLWFADTGSRTVTLTKSAGSGFKLTGDLTWGGGAGDTITVVNNTNDANLEIQGDIAPTTGTANWTRSASATITLSGTNSQSIDFNGKTVEEIIVNKTAGDVTMTGAVTTAGFDGQDTGTGDFDPNGQTITIDGNCSWAAAFTFETGDTDVMDGSDWQIGGNFTADGQTLPADSGWDLDVTGTAVASGAGDVSFSTAGTTPITATGWNNGGNNSGWNFGAAGLSIPVAMHHYTKNILAA